MTRERLSEEDWSELVAAYQRDDMTDFKTTAETVITRVVTAARLAEAAAKDELIASWIRRHQESGHALAEAEAEVQRLRNARQAGREDVLKLLSEGLQEDLRVELAAVPDGAAKGDGA